MVCRVFVVCLSVVCGVFVGSLLRYKSNDVLIPAIFGEEKRVAIRFLKDSNSKK